MVLEPASRMDGDRERALVARSRFDASAFGELYDFYLPRVFGFVLRRVGDRTVAEDVTAATFERALGAVRRADFRNDAFGGWLYRVASNAVVDHVRHDGRRDGHVGDAEQVGDERAASAFAGALDREVLRRMLMRLPDHHRRIVVLKFFDGLEPDELAAALGCSRATVAVKLHRALRALRAAVAAESTDAA